jgi:hypothetical protein
LLQLYGLHFIAATTFAIACLHAASGTGFLIRSAQLPGVKTVHTIVQVHGKTSANYKVDQEQYKRKRFFHDTLQR